MRTLSICGCVFLAACAGYEVGVDDLRSKAMLLEPGMSKQQVLGLLGAPAQRSFKGTAEAMTFCGMSPFVGSQFYTVWMSNGAVVGVTDYLDRYNDMGNCANFAAPIDWGQVPADIRIEIK